MAHFDLLADPEGLQSGTDHHHYELGERAVLLEKAGAAALRVYALTGRLYLSDSGWLLLSVPAALLRGAFDALHVPGAELPLRDGKLEAHVSVMSPEEIAQVGGPGRVSERGHAFSFNVGPVKTVAPANWPGVSRVWYLTVDSPGLRALRRSYGLEPLRKGYDHHITFAIRKAHVLGANPVSKAASEVLHGSETHPAPPGPVRPHDEEPASGPAPAAGTPGAAAVHLPEPAPPAQAAGADAGAAGARAADPAESPLAGTGAGPVAALLDRLLRGELHGPGAADADGTGESGRVADPAQGLPGPLRDEAAGQPHAAPRGLLGATKTADSYAFAGDVQGVHLRAALHRILDRLRLPGMAVNDARTGRVTAEIGGPADQQQAALAQLRAYMDKNPRVKQWAVAQASHPERLRPVSLSDQDLERFFRRQGFTSYVGYEHDPALYRRHWIQRRYRLQPDAAGALSGLVPELAYRQLRGLEPVYGSQIRHPEQFAEQFWLRHTPLPASPTPDAPLEVPHPDLTTALPKAAAFEDAAQEDPRVGATCPHCGSTATFGARARERLEDGTSRPANAFCTGCKNGFGVEVKAAAGAAPTLRPMAVADLPHFRAIEDKSFGEPYDDETFKNLLGSGKGVLAEVEGKPAGYLLYGPDLDEPGLTYIRSLATHPDFRRRGVATALLQHLGPGPASLHVAPDNAAARQLYAAHGFVKQRDVHYGRPAERMVRRPEPVKTAALVSYHDLLQASLRRAAGETDTEPTAEQKEAGNYKKGRWRWRGLEIAIENPLGSTRSGVGKDGKPWKTTMRAHYGYVARGGQRSEADGDHLDVFLADEDGPVDADLNSGRVFVVNQNDPETGKFDEHKSVIGCTTEADARELYLANYEKGWKGLGSIAALTVPQYKQWVRDGDTSKPLVSPPPPTAAVDLDGTVAEYDGWKGEGHFGDPLPKGVELLGRLRHMGFRIIIFTTRGNTKKVRAWLDEHKLPYDHVNENPDQPAGASGKVIADLYVDDRARNINEPMAELVAAAEAVLEKGAAMRITGANTALGRLLGKSGWSEAYNRPFPFPPAVRSVLHEGPRQLEQRSPAGVPDLLPGGRADGMPESAFPRSQLTHGIAHEQEHTSSPAIASEIARDHLAEDRHYYTRLSAAEKVALLLKTAPFQSKRQMRWMFATHPAMARRWADHTPSVKALPETAHHEHAGRPAEKAATRLARLLS